MDRKQVQESVTYARIAMTRFWRKELNEKESVLLGFILDAHWHYGKPMVFFSWDEIYKTGILDRDGTVAVANCSMSRSSCFRVIESLETHGAILRHQTNGTGQAHRVFVSADFERIFDCKGTDTMSKLKTPKVRKPKIDKSDVLDCNLAINPASQIDTHACQIDTRPSQIDTHACQIDTRNKEENIIIEQKNKNARGRAVRLALPTFFPSLKVDEVFVVDYDDDELEAAYQESLQIVERGASRGRFSVQFIQAAWLTNWYECYHQTYQDWVPVECPTEKQCRAIIGKCQKSLIRARDFPRFVEAAMEHWLVLIRDDDFFTRIYLQNKPDLGLGLPLSIFINFFNEFVDCMILKRFRGMNSQKHPNGQFLKLRDTCEAKDRKIAELEKTVLAYKQRKKLTDKCIWAYGQVIGAIDRIIRKKNLHEHFIIEEWSVLDNAYKQVRALDQEFRTRHQRSQEKKTYEKALRRFYNDR